ncbi:MAG: helix-turn-helix domain-containing protein [Prevotella sp.]|nr:helix-turn-helix domain-containing protein [Prevotella sp.]
MKKRLLLLLAVLATTMMAAVAKSGTCRLVPVVPERLPDLTMPRSGHSTFFVNGTLVVTGGHTTNFVPTPTAEYYTNGEWHQLPMSYSHDNGFAVVLRTGEVLIGGGHAEELGVGQTYTLERFIPQTYTFEGFGCLDRRRVLANATQLADGCVIVCGNHYANDAVGCYDGQPQVEHVKSLRQGRSNPYILPVAADDALILGANDIYDRRPDTVWVDRLKGDAFRVPLLEQWRLVYTDQPFTSTACAMADNSYLLMATNGGGQLGFVVVNDTTFSLLPTACPVPMKTQFGPVVYRGSVAVDRKRQRGYVAGADSLFRRQYILAVDYGQQPAALTLYYTDSLEHAAVAIPVLTPDGDLILAGGIPNNNYKPLSSVWRYHFASPKPTAAFAGLPVWLLAGLAVLLAGMSAYIILYIRRRKKRTGDEVSVAEDSGDVNLTDGKAAELMERIGLLMAEEHLYLRTDLRLKDVAASLHTNSSYVSESINTMCGKTFSQFVNELRVRHAQELMRQHPDMKMVAITSASGFTSETSFFRNFKAVTGMTPREWVASQ